MLRRIGDYGLAFVVLGLLAALAARLDFVPASKPAGRAIVSDGDSLAIGNERIRLIGIDAPEFNQICRRPSGDYSCGRDARQKLSEIIGGRSVECSGWRRDRYERLLATCSVGETVLNLAMVEAGWAVAYGDFEAEEREARRRQVGLWQGSFDRPRDWRDSHGATAEGSHSLLGALGDWLRGLFNG